jgi:rhodanese-related sulfurtransferase
MPKPCGKPGSGGSADVELIEPEEAAARQADGAVLIDVRSESARRSHGVIEGSVPADKSAIDRDFGFASEDRLPEIMGPDQQLIVYCSSERGSLPVATRLLELGFASVAHLRGGFPAWEAAGLPAARADTSSLTQ